MPAGITAFLYLCGLWLAAPVLDRSSTSLADRLRGVIVLGVALPFALAALHLLYVPALWFALLVLVALRFRRRAAALEADPVSYALLGAALIVIWPALVRPLLDGDSLAYHLPNAASWVQSHSLWVARAPYWFYPPASEMFAAGMLASSGRWSLPLAGALPALMLTARLYTLARDTGAPRYAAASVPLAFLCMPLAAFQSGTLQNDLWLAAFFVELLAAARGMLASCAVCAFLKPDGWIEAAIAAIAGRKIPRNALFVSAALLLFWAIRDAVLYLHGPLAAPDPQPAYWSSTIAGNIGNAVPELLRGTALVTPQAFLFMAFLLSGFANRETRRYAAAGSAAFLLYLILPVSYSNGTTNYVTDASSLRYALPAFACGALVACALLRRAPAALAVLAYGFAAWGAWQVLSVFWNDTYTRYAPEIALIAVLAALIPLRIRSAVVAAVASATILAGAWGASSRAGGFYADWMRSPDGHSTGAFEWIARSHPDRIVASNVRSGAVLMSVPHAFTLERDGGDACSTARAQHALLFVGTNIVPDPAELAKAQSCGDTLYKDGAGIVVRPSVPR